MKDNAKASPKTRKLKEDWEKESINFGTVNDFREDKRTFGYASEEYLLRSVSAAQRRNI
jgi:hypothetical protein